MGCGTGQMTKFSANLGFLWQELKLWDAIHAAATAGFDAVECHWPYEVPPEKIVKAVKETGLKMLGLNTRPGDMASGDFGLSAVPGRQEEARRHIDEAIAFAAVIGCANIHVMAGITNGGETADAIYRNNLEYACKAAVVHNQVILIEAINLRDVPGYHLSTLEAAVTTLKALKQPNLKIIFDCYHTQIMQGDIIIRLTENLPLIGHVQIAAVPDRGEPNSGELNYPDILKALDAMGYTGYVGAEYRPRNTTESGLIWLAEINNKCNLA